MSARYRKISPRFWRDEKVRDLTIEEKCIALYLFTGQSNRIGLFNFSPGEATEDLGTLPKTFQEGFKKVCLSLNFGWDERARVLYIPTWWKYNCPENPNVLKACLQDLQEIPQTPLLAEFLSNLEHLPETFHETFVKGLPQPSLKPSPNQEQEQEQEKKNSAPTKNQSAQLEECSGKKRDSRVRQFADYWCPKFLAAFGDKYPWGQKEGSQIKRQLQFYTLERLIALADLFFDTKDDFIRNKAGFTVGVFCSKIPGLISTNHKGSKTDRPLMPELGS